MAKFYIKMRVDFCGEIEAESEADAESKAWTAWGDTADAEIQYDGVYSIDVEALETCKECGETEDHCECEEEEEENEDEQEEE